MLLAVFFWSLNPVAMKIALEHASPNLIATARVISAALLIWGLMLVWKIKFNWRELGFEPFLMGLIEPGINSILFLLAMTMVPLPNVILFSCLLPFIKLLLGRFFLKEPFQVSVWIGGTLAIVGMLIFLQGQELDWNMGLGNALLLLCYLLAGVNQLLTRRVMKAERALLPITACQMTTASLVTLGVLWFDQEIFLFPTMSSTYDWVLVVYLLSSIALPFLLYNRALRQLPMGVASLMIILTIPLGCILSWLLLNEPLTPPLLLGGSLVVLGALIPQIRGFRSRRLAV